MAPIPEMTSNSKNPLRGAVEIIPVSFTLHTSTVPLKYIYNTQKAEFYALSLSLSLSLSCVRVLPTYLSHIETYSSISFFFGLVSSQTSFRINYIIVH